MSCSDTDRCGCSAPPGCMLTGPNISSLRVAASSSGRSDQAPLLATVSRLEARLDTMPATESKHAFYAGILCLQARWALSARRRPGCRVGALTAALFAAVAVCACGSSSKQGSTPTAASRPASLRACLTAAGYTVKTFSPRSLDVYEADGRMAAEVTTFKSSAAARRFARRLVVPGEQYLERVTVWEATAQAHSAKRARISRCVATAP